MDTHLFREKLQPVFENFGVTCCYLFGSRAGQDYYRDSDIDLAVIFADYSPSTHNLELEIELQNVVSEILAPLEVEVDLLFLQKAPIYLKFNVINTAKIIYCVDDEFRTDFEDMTIRDYLDFKPFLEMYYREMAEDLLSKGAKLIIFNSDDMKDGAINFARLHPDVPVIHASGDTSWKEGKNYIELPKFGNTMGRMEYGKMIAGCAAALTTKTGQIGYLGPLINDETRRLTVSAYLGARYCYEKYAGKNPDDLKFKVTWIGFWFNIPGFTSDPTQVADEFINSGYDVIISGIDTTEALVQASKAKAAGKEVWAIPYDYEGACAEAPEVCLGVPYFNWGPAYLRAVEQVKAGTFQSYFEWVGPDWTDINNRDTSAVGFVFGDALSAEAKASLEQFIDELAGGLNLFVGPLNFQDGTPFLAEGETATDLQVWYLPQLLEGMEGQSVAGE